MELMKVETDKNRIEQLIDSVLLRMGRFQKILIALLCINSIIIGINHTVTSFHTYKPEFYCQDKNDTKYFSCSADENEFSNSSIATNQCVTGYIFTEPDTKTIVTEWLLICTRRLQAPLVNTLYFCGVTIGALVCGTLSDYYGRTRLVVICLYGQCVLGISLYFSSSLNMFMILRTLQGFFVQGLQGCSYTLLLEFCAPKFRTGTGVMWECFWAVGLALLGMLAYFVRNWRTLQLVLSIPSILTLLYIWLIPESPRWLLSVGRYNKAFKIIVNIAEKNNDHDLLNKANIYSEDADANSEVRQKLNHQQTDVPEEDNAEGLSVNKKVNLLDIFTNPILRKHLIIMILVWYCVTLSYYGIIYFLPNLAGERHLNFLIGAVIEFFAYVVAFFVLSRLGRRYPMVFYQVVNGFICILIGFIIYLTQLKEAWVDYVIIVLSLIAKGLAVSSFCGMFIYTSELFPTVCRGAALGLCGFWARVGSLTAPQLLILIEYTQPIVPMSIMGIAVILSGLATFMLPESLGRALPNTMEDVNNIWGKTSNKKNTEIDN